MRCNGGASLLELLQDYSSNRTGTQIDVSELGITCSKWNTDGSTTHALLVSYHCASNDKCIMRSIAILCIYFAFTEVALVVAQQVTSNPTTTPTMAPIPAPVPDRACYSNLTEIDIKNELKDPLVVETFVLCPDTVYPIGVFGPDNVFVDGYVPLRPRSNTTYSCGEDGKASNNCTFSGEIYQVLHMFTTYNNENKVGIVVKGITFEKSMESSLLLVAPGDITFIDCVFSVSSFYFCFFQCDASFSNNLLLVYL
jgi:hypothetical protein